MDVSKKTNRLKVKPGARYFLSSFYFLPNDSASKAMKKFFYFI